MSDFPVFNYRPMESILAYLQKDGSDEAMNLIRGLKGEEGCCWGNPCCYKGCLACFCRGNIKFLTTSQAYTQAGKLFLATDLEGDGRVPVIKICIGSDPSWFGLDGVSVVGCLGTTSRVFGKMAVCTSCETKAQASNEVWRQTDGQYAALEIKKLIIRNIEGFPR
jgi:hypothetical protein